jgi:hypothetical protein
VIALAVVLALQGPLQTAPPPVQLGIAVRPETVMVGTQFLIVARLRAPEGATIEWPSAPDTSETIEIVSSRMIDSSSDSVATEETARWRLTAWDTGTVTILFDDAVVRAPELERRVPLRTRVYVRSVLPADTALHVPKPTRDILAAQPPWWRWILVAVAAAALISLLLWWYLRRRRRKPPPAPVDALQHAEKEFARVERMGLLEAGERGRFVALMLEVLRDYFALRVPGASSSLTSTELMQYLKSRPQLPLQRLGTLLAEVDLVKFARRAVTAERARELGHEARAIVRDAEKVVVRQQASTAEKAA